MSMTLINNQITEERKKMMIKYFYFFKDNKYNK